MISKSRLAIILSKLKTFNNIDEAKEQYATDSEIAAEVLWHAHMVGDLKDSEIADLGCGTGILGIGALILGAKFVHLVDDDESALGLLRNNIKFVEDELELSFDYNIVHNDISGFNKKVDLVLENPPFGTRVKHADREFLRHAFTISNKIYTFHKSETHGFIAKFAKDNNYKVTNCFEFSFPLKQTHPHHIKKLHRIPVSCFRLEKHL